MKLEPLFTAEKNILVRLSDGEKIATQSLPVLNLDTLDRRNDFYIAALSLAWTDIEPEAGIYNEELLAQLREALKRLEETGRFVIIIPSIGTNALLTADKAEAFTKAMTHTARRIKDARIVIGFAVPSEFFCARADDVGTENDFAVRFIEELSIKHGHYVFFVDESAFFHAGQDAELWKAGIVLYTCAEHTA